MEAEHEDNAMDCVVVLAFSFTADGLRPPMGRALCQGRLADTSIRPRSQKSSGHNANPGNGGGGAKSAAYHLLAGQTGGEDPGCSSEAALRQSSIFGAAG